MSKNYTATKEVDYLSETQLVEGEGLKPVGIWDKFSTTLELRKAKFFNFLKEERSARGYTEEGWLIYAAIIIGIALLWIAIQFLTGGFNDIGNFFTDGVNGTIDQSGLNQWGDETNGFNRK